MNPGLAVLSSGGDNCWIAPGSGFSHSNECVGMWISSCVLC